AILVAISIEGLISLRSYLPITAPCTPTSLPTSSCDIFLFAFRISYENPLSSNPKVRPMYNGNVSATTWRTSSDNIQRKYEYEYDDLDRLLGAYFRIPNSAVQGSYD